MSDERASILFLNVVFTQAKKNLLVLAQNFQFHVSICKGYLSHLKFLFINLSSKSYTKSTSFGKASLINFTCVLFTFTLYLFFHIWVQSTPSQLLLLIL